MIQETKLVQNYSYVQLYKQRRNQIDSARYDAAGEETEEDVRNFNIPKFILAGPAMSSDEESILSENLIPIDIKYAESKPYSSRTPDEEILQKPEFSFNSKTSARSLSSTRNGATMEEATEAALSLLNDLKSLWLNVSAIGPSPSTTALCGGDFRLPHLFGLCSFIVKEMEAEWKSLISNQSDVARVKELQEANHLLIEQLEHCRTIQSCLESEVNSLVKEKVFMLDEIKELSVQVVALREDANETNSKQNNNLLAIDSESSASFGFNVDAEELNANIKKRETDFDSIMEAVKERDNNMTLYQEQMKKYDEELITLQKQIEKIVNENTKLQEDYQKAKIEKEQIIQENDHYEIILRLILQEKQQGDYDLNRLLKNILEKLNEINLHSSCVCDKKCSSKLAVVESALQLVQEQNGNYRSEAKELRDNLGGIAKDYLNCKYEMEQTSQTHKSQMQQLEKSLHFKIEELEQLKKLHNDNYNELNAKYSALMEENENVVNLLHQTRTNLLNLEDSFKDLQKVKLKLQKKLQDAQSGNVRLGDELQEYKQNMTDLNEIVNQLRSNIREQKIQWTERLRAGTEEITQNKVNCKWLQSQVDHLNTQLRDANERLRIHERDKSTLAQQMLSADEERKVVDRKLQELRTALQGDAALREALMERNEALQVEINRLRKSNLMNLELNNNFIPPDGSDLKGTISMAPSDVSGTDTVSSYNNWSMDVSPSLNKLENNNVKNPYSVVDTNDLLRKYSLRSVASAQVEFKSYRETE